MIDPLTGESAAERTAALRWASRVVEQLDDAESLDDIEAPEPPAHIKERREERRKAEQRRRERIQSDEYEPVEPGSECFGLGVRCARCGEKLPEPGEGPRRCEQVGEA